MNSNIKNETIIKKILKMLYFLDYFQLSIKSNITNIVRGIPTINRTQINKKL